MYPKLAIFRNAWWNTLGNVINMSEGPLSGLTPTEKAAGKIISPASRATMKSITLMLIAEDVRYIPLQYSASRTTDLRLPGIHRCLVSKYRA